MVKGPTPRTCVAVDIRDGEACVRCGRPNFWGGFSRHHRQLRRHGDHTPANLIVLCGSGTTGCHGLVHANPAESKLLGLIVSGWCRAMDVPIWRGSERRWAFQDEDGSLHYITAAQAEKRQEELGIIP